MLKCKFFTPIYIVTENSDGDPYAVTAANIQEIFEDWVTGHSFVPDDDAPVYLVVVNNKVIDSSKYVNFKSVLHYLCYLDSLEEKRQEEQKEN